MNNNGFCQSRETMILKGPTLSHLRKVCRKCEESPHLRKVGRMSECRKDGRGVWRNVVEGVWDRPTAGGQGV